MSDLDRRQRDAVAQTVALRDDLWVSCAAMAFLAVVIGGGLLALSAQYRGGWAISHQVAMDKANAVHKLLFRE